MASSAKVPLDLKERSMTSLIDRDRVFSIRLVTDYREEFMETYDSRISVQYGSEMKEFVVMPSALSKTSGPPGSGSSAVESGSARRARIKPRGSHVKRRTSCGKKFSIWGMRGLNLS